MTYKEIVLHNGLAAKVSPEDYEELSKSRWHAVQGARTNYARGCFRDEDGKLRNVYMHRRIMRAESGQQIDHINRDGLDNRRENLRIVTHDQNCYNSAPQGISQFKGIYRHRKTWQACLQKQGKRYRSCGHSSEESAARAYDKLAIEHFGEHAFLNFPEESRP